METYVHIGNGAVHRRKRALSLAHRELHYPWLVSRASRPQESLIYLWGE